MNGRVIHIPLLNTERLHLRPLQWRDAWAFCGLIGDPRVRRYLGGPVPWKFRLQQFKAALRPLQADSVWAVCQPPRGRLIGLVELGPHKDGTDHEVSYQFAQDTWGCGFGYEAVAAVIKHALDDVGLDRVIAETQAANAASCKLLGRLGMVELDRFHRYGAKQIMFATTNR